MKRRRTLSVPQLIKESGKPLDQLSQESGVARTVFYRFLDGKSTTIMTAAKLTAAFPNLHFNVGRKKYVIREV